MTGDDLRRSRNKLGLTQADLAALLGVSPRTLHTLEKLDERKIDDKYAKIIRKFQRLIPDGLSLKRKTLLYSDNTCLSDDEFQTLSDALGKRIRHIDCEAIIKPNTSSPDAFGDLEYRVTYHGIALGPHRTLVIDHLGNPRGPGDKPSRMVITESPSSGPFREIPAETDVAAEYAIAYVIGPSTGSRPIDRMSVGMQCAGGVECETRRKFDSVGFPLYSDIITDLITVTVSFSGFVPENPRPTATLLRRAAPRFGIDDVSHEFECQAVESQGSYRFGILRPRGGVYYGLGFNRLCPI